MILCLLLPWNIRFFVKAITHLVLHKISTGHTYSCFNSLSILQSQISWYVLKVTIMYSTFVANKATTCYPYEDHESAHVPRKKTTQQYSL